MVIEQYNSLPIDQEELMAITVQGVIDELATDITHSQMVRSDHHGQRKWCRYDAASNYHTMLTSEEEKY